MSICRASRLVATHRQRSRQSEVAGLLLNCRQSTFSAGMMALLKKDTTRRTSGHAEERICGQKK